jgi:hypothetical protein
MPGALAFGNPSELTGCDGNSKRTLDSSLLFSLSSFSP